MNSGNKKSVLAKISVGIKIVTDILAIPLMILAVLVTGVLFNAKKNNEVPSLLGYSVVKILSGSMEASGFNKNDTVLVKKTNALNLIVGDVVAFYNYVDINNIAPETVSKTVGTNKTADNKEKIKRSKIWFHEIVEISFDSDGTKWFKTKGTSNLKEDPYWIRQDYVIGKYAGSNSFIKEFLSFLAVPNGIIWLLLIPTGILLFVQLLKFIDVIDTLALESKVKNGIIQLDDARCVKKQIGKGMSKIAKAEVLLDAPLEKMEIYHLLLYGESMGGMEISESAENIDNFVAAPINPTPPHVECEIVNVKTSKTQFECKIAPNSVIENNTPPIRPISQPPPIEGKIIGSVPDREISYKSVNKNTKEFTISSTSIEVEQIYDDALRCEKQAELIKIALSKEGWAVKNIAKGIFEYALQSFITVDKKTYDMQKSVVILIYENEADADDDKTVLKSIDEKSSIKSVDNVLFYGTEKEVSFIKSIIKGIK